MISNPIQEKLAAKLGVRFQTASRWEHGHAKPSPLAMKMILEFLHSMGKDRADLLREYIQQM